MHNLREDFKQIFVLENIFLSDILKPYFLQSEDQSVLKNWYHDCALNLKAYIWVTTLGENSEINAFADYIEINE